MGIHLYKLGKRRCLGCSKIFPLSREFFTGHKGALGGVGYLCRPCKVTESSKKGIRRRIIEDSKFTCSHCHLSKPDNYGFFDVDHIKPVLRQKSGTFNYFKVSDIGKVQVLCPNCHRMKTLEDRKQFRSLN